MYEVDAKKSVIKRIEDGAWIPIEAENMDYQQYLAWAAAQAEKPDKGDDK